MIDESLIKLLRCPVTRQPLRIATESEKLAAGLTAESEALATLDGARVYPCHQGLPVLLPTANEVVSEG